MQQQRVSTQSRRPTNLSINSQLLDEAKSLGINVSRSAESGIQAAVLETKREMWLAENKEAIDSSNDFVETHGLPLARFRNF